MTFIRWIFSLAILAMWCALIGTGLFVAMHEPSDELPEAQAIVVLGGGAESASTLTPDSTQRVAHAVTLFEAGAAPQMVFTGGGAIADAPIMAREAAAAGVTETALVIERRAQSTLQNALFTADLGNLDKTQPIILVTQRYHLPRAWASFRWAGFQSIHLSAADPDAGLTLDQRLLWEAVKWPVNVLRAGAASAAVAADVPRESWVSYLQ
ncbi:MAG: YdcF family protein [Pseudomonadota bacterium]